MVKHFTMLPCHTHYGSEFFRMFLELLDKRTHLYSLWTCSEYKHYCFHVDYIFSLFIPIYKFHNTQHTTQQISSSLLSGWYWA